MQSRIVAAYVVCAFIWGTTWFAIRVCIAPDGYPTMTAVALRFALAALVLIPLALRARPWPKGRAWAYLVLAGVLDAAAYMLVYLGEEHVSGGIAAVVYGTQPLILAIMLKVVRIEALTARHIAGAIVSLAGVALLFLDRLDVSANQAAAVALVLLSVVLSTSYSVIMKRHSTGVHGIAATTIFLTVTAIVLGAVALVDGGGIPWPPPAMPTLALLYLAIVGSVVAFLVYFWLLDRTSLLVTSTLVFVFPLVALVTDVLYEHEISLGVRAYVGVAITLAGLVVSLRRR
ncbi:MAG: EamA family transporter [Kofleriaceae bacterium]|nr:EamA family transporter [Kofleriaceae bacterium]